MNIIDTHCHLDFFRENLDAVLVRAKQALVDSMICCGTEISDWDTHLAIAQANANVHYTVGIHPNNVTPHWEKDLEILIAYFLRNLKPIAIGEIGLDYHGIGSNSTLTIKQQKNAFFEQLKIAQQYDTPIIVHSRDAFEDCKTMIDRAGCDWSRVVIHCFSENADAIREINARGGRGSFTGIVTYKSAEKIRQALIAQGLEKLMLETDSPFLAPIPHRSKQNEPALLREIARHIAKLFHIPEAELSSITTQNAKEFFRFL